MAKGCASAAADLPAFCTTRVVPSATTLTPSTPIATHSHLREGLAAPPKAPACATGTAEVLEEGEMIRLMIFLRKIQKALDEWPPA
jgi:hypothetical protein